jgi:hypothetical protein
LIDSDFWPRTPLEEPELTIWTIGEIAVGAGCISGLPRY